MKTLLLHMLLFCAWLLPGCSSAEETGLTTNLFRRVESLFAQCGGLDPDATFYDLKTEGFCNLATNALFLGLCGVVSNNLEEIAQHWSSFNTNEAVRVSVLNAACFTGLNTYTNFTARLSALVSADSTSDEWFSVRFMLFPHGTPQEDYILLNHNTPGVSNIVERILTVSRSRHDDSITEICERILSGAAKTEYEEDRDAGVL